MKLWIINKWDNVRASFWFVPTLMVAASIALSAATIHFDSTASSTRWVARFGWTFMRGPDGSRAVLATIAASMMTIASVIFSITIVALQLASAQFGPRLLRNFMRDQGNQVAIGTFIATFTYCLLVLRTINGTEGEQFVPHVSVTIGIALALVSLGVFIYFIHHAAESIQAENVIASVSRDLDEAIDRLYPEAVGDESDSASTAERERDLPEGFDREARSVTALQSNYVQAVDLDALLRIAKDGDLVLHVVQRPGKFCFVGSDLALVGPGERVDDDLAGAIRGKFYFGQRRTLAQDVEFAIDQLVEVAVRALSPGINDPFTAMNCVDRIGAALCKLAERSIPSPYRYDDEGRLRLVADRSTVSGIVDTSFHQIRQAARTNTSVTLRLLETIAAVGRHARSDDLRAALRRHAEIVHRGSQDGLKDSLDRREADGRYAEAMRSLANTADASSAKASHG